MRLWRGLVGTGKRVALGGKNPDPTERKRNGRSRQENHHEQDREARVQMAKRGEKVKHGLVEGDLFRREIVAGDDAAFHYKFYLFEERNAFKRIAVHGDDVGVVAGFN